MAGKLLGTASELIKQLTKNFLSAWVDLGIRKPLRPWSVMESRVTGLNQLAPSPSYSEMGEERDEFSPIGRKINLPKEARQVCFFSIFIFFLLLKCIYTIYKCTSIYICTKTPLCSGLLVDLLSSHYRSQVVEL